MWSRSCVPLVFLWMILLVLLLRSGRAGPGTVPRAHFPGASFARGTWISTPARMVPIETVRVGDLVHTYDFRNGAIRKRPVDAIHSRGTREVVTLDLGAYKLRVTPHHRFWSASDHEWKEAGELTAGALLGVGSWYWLRPDPAAGPPLKAVVAEEELTEDLEVFNLDIHISDNYLVGPDRIIAADRFPGR